MKIIGLTGSIAMGKSETARMFAARGVPVFDADAAVHAVYAKGGAAVARIAALCPEAVQHGAVDRARLSAAILADPALLKQVEAAVHPLVADARARFLDEARAAGERAVLLDIPLLFETGREGEVDVIITVSAPAEMQRARALARPGMTADKLDQILARQMPDAEKRARSDFVVDTSRGLDEASRQVDAILREIRDA